MKPDKTDFTEDFVRINAMRFKRWIFEPGMLFRSESKWWGDKGSRDKTHNGLDLMLYETDKGVQRALDPDIKIPIMYEGTIVRNIKDFLGWTFFAAHQIYERDSRLFTIYGHLKKPTDPVIGKFFNKGEILSALSEPAGKKIPSHLHLSVALIPGTISIETLTWKTLEENENIIFINPKNLI